MKCPRCQHDNPSAVKFCGECGRHLELACPACTALNPAPNKFCHECGADLSPAAAASRFAAPDTYTPRHLAERILTSKAALEGERKQVTVLFADLKGSMELVADRDPEEARELLDPVIELMMEAVHRYEGTVNQVMGDGIMALFGAPIAHEDHAARACYAALRMQASVRRYAGEVHRAEGATHIRIGLHSGDVVVRSIGSDLRMDYSAVGQTTHLAARMEQIAAPDTILISADTLRIAEDYVQVQPLGLRSVKGLAEPLEVYELTGAGPARSRLQASAARGLTRLVGRGHEMQVVRDALRHADSGRGQVLVIAGDPGVGKSRLVWETTHSPHVQGWLVLEARSVSYGRGSAYLPVLELLRAYFALEDRDATPAIQEKVTGKLLTLDRALEPALPALLSLLDVPVEDRAWGALDPPQRRQRTLDALGGLLLRESRLQPLLLVFEDLHWIDDQTQALLDTLVESLPMARAVLLATHRPEYEHRWWAKSYCTPLRLDALPVAGARELLDGLLGDHPSVEPAKAVLIGRTEGNPFFLEESVRSLVETGALTGERGAHWLVRDLSSIQIPPTVQAVLAARIDRLPAKEKHLLEAAAVVGKDVPLPLLAAIADEPEGELRRGLSYLQAAEFLYETALFPDPEFTFKHPLTHEVVLRNLLRERQRALSARLVDTIERMYPNRVGEYAEILAHQARRGELWGKAVSYSRQSGARAASRAAHREAVACLQDALTALECLPDDRGRQEQAVDIRLELAGPLFALAELRRRSLYLREAEQRVGSLDDRTRASRTDARLAHQLWIEGDPEAALECARRAVANADAVTTPELRIPASLVLGQIHHVRGDLARAVPVLLGTLEALEGYSSGHYPALVGLLNPVSPLTWLAWVHADLGAFSEGHAFAREAVRIAEIMKQSYVLVHAYFGQGLCHMLQGDIANALPVLDTGLRLSLDADISISFCLIAPVAGAVYALGGRREAGIALLQKAFEDAASYGVGHYQARRLTFLGEAYLLAGRVEEAAHTAARALELAQRHQERGNEAWARHLLGDIALHGATWDIEAAAGHYRGAMTLADGLGMRPLVAHCRLSLGRLYRRTGERDSAQQHLTIATMMYREMDMRSWLEQAEAEMNAGEAN